MSIEAMKQAIDALNEAVAFREGGRQKAIDAIAALRTAITQAEAQQPATTEPVAWLYIEEGEVMFGHPNGYRPPNARPLVFGDTYTAPGVPADVARDAERWRTFLATRPSNTHEGIIAAIDAACPAQKGGE